VDGVFADPAERVDVQALAQEKKIYFNGLWLEAPFAVLRQRVLGRSDDASDATADVVERQLARDPGDLSQWRRIDASGSPEAVLELTKAALHGGTM